MITILQNVKKKISKFVNSVVNILPMLDNNSVISILFILFNKLSILSFSNTNNKIIGIAMREIHGPFIIFKPINVGMITILQNVKKKISNSNVGILSMKLFIIDNILFIRDGMNRYKI
jgi:hypothetical protein